MQRSVPVAEGPGEGSSKVEGGIFEVSGVGGCVSPQNPACEVSPSSSPFQSAQSVFCICVLA